MTIKTRFLCERSRTQKTYQGRDFMSVACLEEAGLSHGERVGWCECGHADGPQWTDTRDLGGERLD